MCKSLGFSGKMICTWPSRKTACRSFFAPLGLFPWSHGSQVAEHRTHLGATTRLDGFQHQDWETRIHMGFPRETETANHGDLWGSTAKSMLLGCPIRQLPARYSVNWLWIYGFPISSTFKNASSASSYYQTVISSYHGPTARVFATHLPAAARCMRQNPKNAVMHLGHNQAETPAAVDSLAEHRDDFPLLFWNSGSSHNDGESSHIIIINHNDDG